MKSLASACTNAVIVSCGAGAVSGFGSVVAETTAFAGLCDKLAGFNGNPLIVAMIAMMIMTLVGGSGPAGLGVYTAGTVHGSKYECFRKNFRVLCHNF